MNQDNIEGLAQNPKLREIELSLIAYAKEFSDERLLWKIQREAKNGHPLPRHSGLVLARWLFNQSRFDPIMPILSLIRGQGMDHPAIDEFEGTFHWSTGNRERGLELARQAHLKWGTDSLHALVRAMEEKLAEPKYEKGSGEK